MDAVDKKHACMCMDYVLCFSTWTTTYQCLKPHLVSCDNEVRETLDGLVDAFSDVCGAFASAGACAVSVIVC